MRPRLLAPALAVLALGSVASVAMAQGDGDIDIRLADVCSRTVTGMQRVQALEARSGPTAELRQLAELYDGLADYCRRHGIDIDVEGAEDDA